MPTTPAEKSVREDGDVVSPQNLGVAAPARRWWTEDRAAHRHARDHDVQEAAERESRREDEGGCGDVHVALARVAALDGLHGRHRLIENGLKLGVAERAEASGWSELAVGAKHRRLSDFRWTSLAHASTA